MHISFGLSIIQRMLHNCWVRLFTPYRRIICVWDYSCMNVDSGKSWYLCGCEGLVTHSQTLSHTHTCHAFFWQTQNRNMRIHSGPKHCPSIWGQQRQQPTYNFCWCKSGAIHIGVGAGVGVCKVLAFFRAGFCVEYNVCTDVLLRRHSASRKGCHLPGLALFVRRREQRRFLGWTDRFDLARRWTSDYEMLLFFSCIFSTTTSLV